MSVAIDHSARNRSNARHSTGPQTIEGKARSSKNAVKYGIFCKDLVLPGEDPELFEQFKRDMLKSLGPRDMLELELAEQIVVAQWRLKRARAAEHDMLQKRIDHIQRNLLDGPRQALEQMLRETPDLPNWKVTPLDSIERKALFGSYKHRLAAIERADQVASPNAASVLIEMMSEEGSPLLLMQQYQRRLESAMHRCLNQLRKLQSRDLAPPSELAQAMLGPDDADDEQNVKNEAREDNDERETMDDEPNVGPVHGSSFSVQTSPVSPRTGIMASQGRPVCAAINQEGVP